MHWNEYVRTGQPPAHKALFMVGENPLPALSIDKEHCYFRITSYTLISGGLGTVQTFLSEWLSPLRLLCAWTEKDFFLLLARRDEVRRRKSLGGRVTGGKRAGRVSRWLT